jgi:hypothetical protein
VLIEQEKTKMEDLNMHNHIEKLIEATKNINVTYTPAYTQDGKPDIGVRKEGNDSVIVDGVCWLIAGDICNKVYGTKIDDIKNLGWYKPNGMLVSLRAQALIAGKIVQVHLGKRDIVTMTKIANEGGIMVLATADN